MFYVVFLINKSGQRGYASVTPKGIHVALGGIDGSVCHFDDYDAANKFIRDNRLEKNGTIACVKSSEDLANEKVVGLRIGINESVVYIENEHGAKIFYDSATDQYFFRKQDIGFCLWKEADMEKVNTMIEGIEKNTGFKCSVKNMKDFKK